MREFLVTFFGILERIGMLRKQPIAHSGKNHVVIQSLVGKELLDNIQDHTKHINDYDESTGDLNAVHVSSHLLMRHTQLHLVEQLTREHQVHSELEKKYAEEKAFPLSDSGQGVGSQNERLHPAERAYRLAVTDLFVEKAQGFLDERAISYQRSGKLARRIASTIIFIFMGAVYACWQMKVHEGQFAKSWLELLSGFVRAFTAYGFIVIAAVGFWRYSKSMLDQAERLYERRHSLRQGRLFVHLKDGVINIDEMEKAFRWSDSPENAFAGINTEASAPWGGIAKEMAKGFPEILKTALQNVNREKSGEKDK